MTKKPSGTIGSTKFSFDGKGSVEVSPPVPNLPSSKEELEALFAEKFVMAYNKRLPFGPGTEIASFEQLDTSDLDFKVKCSIASYLELAEVLPFGTEVWRRAKGSGEIEVYALSKWIFENIVKRKAKKYGALAAEIILLIYVTHRELAFGELLKECLRSFFLHEGGWFRAIFTVHTDGEDRADLDVLHPTFGERPATPRHYLEKYYYYLAPEESIVGEGNEEVSLWMSGLMVGDPSGRRLGDTELKAIRRFTIRPEPKAN